MPLLMKLVCQEIDNLPAVAISHEEGGVVVDFDIRAPRHFSLIGFDQSFPRIA